MEVQNLGIQGLGVKGLGTKDLDKQGLGIKKFEFEKSVQK